MLRENPDSVAGSLPDGGSWVGEVGVEELFEGGPLLGEEGIAYKLDEVVDEEDG